MGNSKWALPFPPKITKSGAPRQNFMPSTREVKGPSSLGNSFPNSLWHNPIKWNLLTIPKTVFGGFCFHIWTDFGTQRVQLPNFTSPPCSV